MFINVVDSLKSLRMWKHLVKVSDLWIVFVFIYHFYSKSVPAECINFQKQIETWFPFLLLVWLFIVLYIYILWSVFFFTIAKM